MNTTKTLIPSWYVLSSALALVLLIGILCRLGLAVLGRRDFVKSKRPYREGDAPSLPIEAKSAYALAGLIG